jgi:hypothetical protein
VSETPTATGIHSLPEPWLRLTAKQGKAGATESAKAHEAFQSYYTTSPNLRSLRQTGLLLKKSETLMERWSRRFSWVIRADAWDRHQAQIVAAECERTRRDEAEKWTRREHDVYEQDYNASRLMVLQGVKTAKLPPTEGSRWQVGAVAMIKGGHQLSIDCIKGARPESPGGQIADDIEFVPLTNPDRQGSEE